MIKGKKILITGGTGFIGSHLSEMLVRQGNSVTCFDRYNINNNWGWLEDSELSKDINIILGDIRDFDSVHDATAGQDIIFHLAALIGIPYSYKSPLAYIRTNIEGTYNVLESAKLRQTEKIIITSTSETYGTAQTIPIDESHPLVGQSPYSASKISADQLALSYHLSFDSPITIARPFNTYGPRQSSRAIIPTIFSQAILGDTLTLGNLSPTRDLTYVDDTCKGFLEIANHPDLNGEVINIGSNQEISIGDLAELIKEIVGKDLNITESQDRLRPEKSEVDRLLCDNSKICKLTDWKPEIGLKDGLRNVYNWMQSIDLNQIYKADRYNV
ncbi:GDP-mannose 4,6-dehydratase [Gammaproteobacteria bacterium]|nr:GDP-mannose 4,6-dehydratase [Gammaproteobacteria bacterium]